MDFDLSEEHRLLRQSVRGFVGKEIAPQARQVDESEEFPWPARSMTIGDGTSEVQRMMISRFI